MEGQLDDAERLATLHRIARAAVWGRMTPSAVFEIDAITNEAVTQLLEYARDHRIESPEALVSVIASRAAIKARNDWERGRDELQLPGDNNAVADEGRDGNRGPDSDFIALLKNHSETLQIESMRAMAAIAGLKPTDRNIAELTFLEEWKPAEVAAELGKPVETVKNRLVAIRKTLRQSLEF